MPSTRQEPHAAVSAEPPPAPHRCAVRQVGSPPPPPAALPFPPPPSPSPSPPPAFLPFPAPPGTLPGMAAYVAPLAGLAPPRLPASGGGGVGRRPPRVAVARAATPGSARLARRGGASAPAPAPARSVRMGVPAATGAAALLLAEDVYGQIALGGVAIIASGVVGALITGWLVNRNYDVVRLRVGVRGNGQGGWAGGRVGGRAGGLAGWQAHGFPVCPRAGCLVPWHRLWAVGPASGPASCSGACGLGGASGAGVRRGYRIYSPRIRVALYERTRGAVACRVLLPSPARAAAAGYHSPTPASGWPSA